MPTLDVDWFDLELAFRDTTGTDNYLDTQTGDIVSVVAGFADEKELRGVLLKDPQRFVHLPPLTAVDARRFMGQFIDSIEAGYMKRRLQSQRHGAGSLTRCVAILRTEPAMLSRYHRFEQSAFWEFVEGFLRDHGVVPADRAPTVDLFEGLG